MTILPISTEIYPSPCAVDDSIAVNQKLDEAISRYALDNTFNGSVLVYKNGDILLNKGYGMADHEKGRPNTPETKFFLASITKSFTAVAIMQLVEQGLVDLNEPIIEYLPQCPNWKDITIRQILLHTSGLTRYDELPYKCSESLPDYEMIQKAQDLPLLFKPGSGNSYSNLGFYLLGVVIEKASGKPYAQYMEENIFEPTGMIDTANARNIGDNDLCAQPYSIYNGVAENNTLIPMYKLYSAGSIYSTVNDMYLYYEALFSEKLIEKSSMEVIFTPMYISREFYPCMGATDNLFCSFERYPKDDTVIIVLSNVTMSKCMPMKNELTSLVFSH